LENMRIAAMKIIVIKRKICVREEFMEKQYEDLSVESNLKKHRFVTIHSWVRGGVR